MPPKGRNRHSGCRVTGVWLDAAGSPVGRAIRFTPERGGLHRGVQYSADPVTVYAGPGGAWAVTLAPSSVVGPYRVVFAGRPPVETRIVVPDAAAARFEECVQ